MHDTPEKEAPLVFGTMLSSYSKNCLGMHFKLNHLSEHASMANQIIAWSARARARAASTRAANAGSLARASARSTRS